MARRQFDLAKNALVRKWYFGSGTALTCTLCTMLLVSGCLGSGLGLGTGPDRSTITGSISTVPDVLSDDDLIKMTVAEADVTKGFIHHLPWANLTTGDGGVVSYVRENGGVRRVCREFIASKHSYDGVAQYMGEICRARMSQDWTLETMEKQD